MNAKLNFIEAVQGSLARALEQDPDVIVFGEDVGDKEGGGVFKVTRGLSDRFGTNRVRSTPISEQAIVGAAIGAAVAGLRPVAELMFMNFVSVAMDQIANHAAKLRFMSGGQTTVPLTIRTAAGAAGGLGGQHSDMLEAWLAHTPGLKVVVPSTPEDAAGLLLSCIFDDDPCVFVEHIALYFGGQRQDVPDPSTHIPIGVAATRREGSDLTLVSYGKSMLDVLACADELAADAIGAEVIDLRTVSPLDTRTVLESVAKTRRLVIVHESIGQCGVGAELAAIVHRELFGSLLAPVERVTPTFTPVPFSSALEAAYLPGPERIRAAVAMVMK